jgi:hypothetical protein
MVVVPLPKLQIGVQLITAAHAGRQAHDFGAAAKEF